MPQPSVSVHPEAEVELASAIDWYLSESPQTAARFAAEVDRAVDEITMSPRRWPAFVAGTRRRLKHRFPYHIVYRHDKASSQVRIIAFAHTSRRPGYWMDRR